MSDSDSAEPANTHRTQLVGTATGKPTTLFAAAAIGTAVTGSTLMSQRRHRHAALGLAGAARQPGATESHAAAITGNSASATGPGVPSAHCVPQQAPGRVRRGRGAGGEAHGLAVGYNGPPSSSSGSPMPLELSRPGARRRSARAGARAARRRRLQLGRRAERAERESVPADSVELPLTSPVTGPHAPAGAGGVGPPRSCPAAGARARVTRRRGICQYCADRGRSGRFAMLRTDSAVTPVQTAGPGAC